MATITGTNGNDQLAGTNGDDNISGLGGNDVISGQSGNDILNGGDGDDVINGGAGLNQLIGGRGNDIYNVGLRTDQITELAGQGIDTVRSIDSFNLATNGLNVENLTLLDNAMGGAIDGTGNALDNIIIGNSIENTLSGGDGNDTLLGGGASDALVGGQGNDRLDGGDDADVMDGGAGNDTYIVDNSDDTVTDTVGSGKDLVLSSVDYSLGGAQEIEALTLTGTADIGGRGNEFANTITGNLGNNMLAGGGGIDILAGGAGDDIYILEDRGNGDSDAGDKVVEGATAGRDLVISYLHDYTIAANVEDLQLRTIPRLAAGIGDPVGGVNATGNALDNTIDGNELDNRIDGGAGNDTLHGSDGSDILIGGIGNDSLIGDEGQDQLIGGTGNDLYVVDDNDDTIVELANQGTDIVLARVNNYTLGDNLEGLGFAGTGNFIATGNKLDNTIFGNTGNDTLKGLDGNDKLLGGSGPDTLTGGNGNDILDGGEGDDKLMGGLGNDTYMVDGQDDQVLETVGGGKDAVISEVDYFLMDGQEIESLTLTGNANIQGGGNEFANTITGNSGGNSLSGGGGVDVLIGGAGSDFYFLKDRGKGDDDSKDKVIEGVGGGIDEVVTNLHDYTLAANVENLRLFTNDAAFAPGVVSEGGTNGTGNALNNLIEGDALDNRLDGQAGNDTLDGEGGNDILIGGLGNDSLEGGAGADQMAGGAGNDLYIVDNVGDKVSELANQGVDTVQTTLTKYALNGDTGANVENLNFTGTGNFNGIGNQLGNVLTGGTGNDTLSGLDGNDVLDGGLGGINTLIGGNGNDTYIIHDAGSSEIVETGDKLSGIDTARSSETSIDLIALGGDNVENIILDDFAPNQGSRISATGNALANIISGNSGRNTLEGGAGNDMLIGGADSDLYILRETDAGDKIIETANGGNFDSVISLLHDYTLAANVEDLFLSFDAAEALTASNEGGTNGTGNTLNNLIIGNQMNNRIDGGAGDDDLRGRGGNDVIIGGAGNDELSGDDGTDQMIGGTGNDTYFVDDNNDTVTELTNQGIDTVIASVANYSLSGKQGDNVENLSYSGTGNFKGTGNKLNNVITGGTGDDVLMGLDGDDTLDGFSGQDKLIGGAGNDTYILHSGTNFDIEEEAGKTGGIDTIRTSEIDIHLYNKLGFENVENVVLEDYEPGKGFDLEAIGNSLDNILIGNSGDNLLQGVGGKDTLIGGRGNDTYIMDTDGSTIIEAADGGHDTVISTFLTYTLPANVEDLVLQTGQGPLTGIGNTLDNTITGSEFGDKMSGMAGNDQLVGNSGDDKLDGSVGNDQLNGGIGNDALDGGIGNDVLVGGDGSDIVIGGAGDDLLAGDAGDDQMVGGAGNDIYGVDSAGDELVELTNQGIDIVVTTLANFNLSDAMAVNIENLEFVGAGGATGNGNKLDNKITSGFGSDRLIGLDGNDTLDGGSGGTDTLIGGTGNDIYILHSGATVHIIETTGLTGGIDTIVTSEIDVNLNALDAANVENITLQDISPNSGLNLNGFGNSLDNVITGNSGNNFLEGGGGKDMLIGGKGDDTYRLSAGDDKDQIIEAANAGRDLVQSGLTDYTLGANLEDLVLVNNGKIGIGVNGTGNALDNAIIGNNLANLLNGGGGNDALFGDSGNDTLIGGTGDDELQGGAGADILTGGGGNDTFLYQIDSQSDLASLGTDTITDFQSGHDVIDIRSLIDAFALNHSDNLFAEGVINLISDGSGKTQLTFDADGVGGNAAVVLATIGNNAAVLPRDIRY